uniref:Uncharacterized protein n=1 Tax=Mustela putorius furo TaxID=9669 RepID=M3XNB6_MUSPF
MNCETIRVFISPPGPITEMPPRSQSQEDIHRVFDEILVQEMLDPNKSSMAGKQRTPSTLPTKPFMEKSKYTFF